MLQITNLQTKYVNQANLKVKTNQIIALIGDNGSGKSSLAKVICGYYKGYSGEINISPQGIGLLTQNPYLQFIGSTVFDELTYSLEQEGERRERIAEILTNCPFDLERKLSELSGGEAQQLLIYKEMMSSKKALVLDETLSNLDRSAKSKIVSQLKASGKAIILITNNLNDTNYASYVYKLENKQLKLTDNQLVESKLMENQNHVALEFDAYKFKYGLNIVTGASSSGKSRLINKLCFTIKKNISLIPQYPFEAVTELTAAHLLDSKWVAKLKLEKCNLEQNITKLSTGELVKVLIIEALESGNKVIVLDEAIEVLDQASQRIVLDVLEGNFETIIIVSHNEYLFNGRHANVVEVRV